MLVHTSNLFFHPFQSELAEKLSGSRAWIACSSATAAPRPSRRA